MDCVLTEQEAFDYFYDLRDSGVTNMFGAAEYIKDHFGISETESRDWLIRWMESFKKKG